ncbi:uncharacterized protein DUF4160 [Promicromonospora sp. AC04]|nr:uncharacterized protein DUF4160 [Promicromonospora sp. AC04]
MEGGWLKRAHVEARLHNIAVRDFGEVGPSGYDDEGFMTSLVADSLRVERIGKFIVYSNDHDPPHVHVRPFGTTIDLRFSLNTGELLDEAPRGIASKQLKSMKAALIENQVQFGRWWEKAHGDVVVAPTNASDV